MLSLFLYQVFCNTRSHKQQAKNPSNRRLMSSSAASVPKYQAANKETRESYSKEERETPSLHRLSLTCVSVGARHCAHFATGYVSDGQLLWRRAQTGFTLASNVPCENNSLTMQAMLLCVEFILLLWITGNCLSAA